jgi:5'-nucleotidase
MKKLTLLICLILSLSSEARLLQIIHTNDLHSYFKGYKDGRGGYAKLKAKIEDLRLDASNKGIEVLQLDAGDFGEGTSFFLSKEGSSSVKALEMLGAEVSVIGNHDHMLGGRILGDQIRKANVKTKFLSANLVPTKEMNLDGIIFHYTDLERASTPIRIIGLSTAEAHFQYPLLPGFILPAISTGNFEADEARKAGKKLVIALTHIGQSTDVELAHKSRNIDLIIGGHSHDRIEKVRYENNLSGKAIPIVQTGAHGLAVGSLLLDIQDDGTFTVVKYQLHNILAAMPEEAEMATFVEEAVHDRNQYFGGRWDEIIGQTNIQLSGYVNGIESSTSSCWGKHMARMSQEATNSDLAIHIAQFEGMSVPPGQISYGDMIENFPHFRNYGDPGWEISTITVNGKTLKTIMRAVINLGQFGLSFYGIEYTSFKIPAFIPIFGNKRFAFGFRVKGNKINNGSQYTIAFPSEIGHAIKLSLGPSSQKLIPDFKSSGVYFWEVMENYIKANSPINCMAKSKIKINAPDLD